MRLLASHRFEVSSQTIPFADGLSMYTDILNALRIMSGTRFARSSKIKLIDVVFVKDERFAHHNVVTLDLKLAECSGFERLRARSPFTFRERHCRLHGQITEVFGFPKNHTVGHALFDI